MADPISELPRAIRISRALRPVERIYMPRGQLGGVRPLGFLYKSHAHLRPTSSNALEHPMHTRSAPGLLEQGMRGQVHSIAPVGAKRLHNTVEGRTCFSQPSSLGNQARMRPGLTSRLEPIRRRVPAAPEIDPQIFRQATEAATSFRQVTETLVFSLDAKVKRLQMENSKLRATVRVLVAGLTDFRGAACAKIQAHARGAAVRARLRRQRADDGGQASST
ncbi:MAG: hypothetical protein SGPRY_014749 [Prymnesium sp.]